MGNCKDCRFWKSQDQKRGKCEKISSIGRLDPSKGAESIDYAGSPVFFTGPEFGCVLFEAKG
jgi:hypothetical protein